MFIVQIIIVIYICILCTNTQGNIEVMIDDFADNVSPFVEGM